MDKHTIINMSGIQNSSEIYPTSNHEDLAIHDPIHTAERQRLPSIQIKERLYLLTEIFSHPEFNFYKPPQRLRPSHPMSLLNPNNAPQSLPSSLGGGGVLTVQLPSGGLPRQLHGLGGHQHQRPAVRRLRGHRHRQAKRRTPALFSRSG